VSRVAVGVGALSAGRRAPTLGVHRDVVELARLAPLAGASAGRAPVADRPQALQAHKETPMTQSDSPVAAKAARPKAKAPPAWLLCASMLVFAVVTIVLVITGQ
jgi:hypothetical protein